MQSMVDFAICVAFFGSLNWLKGFSYGDHNPAGRTAWHKFANFMTSDGWCGIYLGCFVLGALYMAGARDWWAMLMVPVMFGMYGYLSEGIAHKRAVFVCYNGNPAALHTYLNKKYERWIAGSFDKPRRAAIRYTTFAGWGFSACFLPIIGANVYYGLFEPFQLLCFLPPFLYGAIYGAMVVLPNPDKWGETIGRGIYGMALGVALYASL